MQRGARQVNQGEQEHKSWALSSAEHPKTTLAMSKSVHCSLLCFKLCLGLESP